MCLSHIPFSPLIVSPPRSCPCVQLRVTSPLPGSWRGLITFVLVFPPSIDPQVPHAAIFVIAFGVLDHLFVYYILIPVFVKCTSSPPLIVLSYVDKIITRIRGTLSSYAICMNLPFVSA